MIDSKYPNFKDDARDLRLGLSTDGINPLGNMRSTHSTWPVVLTIYNFLPVVYKAQVSNIVIANIEFQIAEK